LQQGVGDHLFVCARAVTDWNICNFNVPNAPEGLHVLGIFLRTRMFRAQKNQFVDLQPFP
jgi:hypothetical protein